MLFSVATLSDCPSFFLKLPEAIFFMEPNDPICFVLVVKITAFFSGWIGMHPDYF